MGTIVVGVDGSAGSDAALRWAASEAALRGTRLRVVYAYQPPALSLTETSLGAGAGIAAPVVVPDDAEQLQRLAEGEARRVVDDAIGRLGNEVTENVELDRVVVQGAPAQSLIESARGADLLVVGSRGRGGFLGLLLGSVSHQVAHHPPCPVAILPPPEDGAGSS